MTKRTKNILLTALVIIAIITAIWLIIQIVIPFLFNAFLWLLREAVAPIIVIICVIIAGFMAINN